MHSWYIVYAVDASTDFDWNLLKSLEALLLERNVTRAAQKVGLSQPAMSRCLGRLRDVFRDELLVRSGKGMVPTARAETLLATLNTIQLQVKSAVAPNELDPRTATNSFTLCAADFAEMLLLPGLMRLLSDKAPGIRIHSIHSTRAPESLLEDRVVDLVLNPKIRTESANVIGQKLFDEEFSCVVRTDHPSVKSRLTLKKYCSLNHLLVSPRGRPGSIVDSALKKLGKKRHVALTIPSFLSAPAIISSTELVATLPTRVAEVYAENLGLRVMRPPLEIPGFSMMQYWSATSDKDPAHRFLRSMVELSVPKKQWSRG